MPPVGFHHLHCAACVLGDFNSRAEHFQSHNNRGSESQTSPRGRGLYFRNKITSIIQSNQPFLICVPSPTGSHIGVQGFVEHVAAPMAKPARERAAVANPLHQPRQPGGSTHPGIPSSEGDGEHSSKANRSQQQSVDLFPCPV